MVYKRTVRRKQPDGTIAEIELPFWHFDVQVDGVRQRRSTRTSDKRIAEQIEAKVRAEMARGNYFPGPPKRTMTVGELRELALERAQQEHVSFATTRSIWKRLVLILGENTPIRLLTERRLYELRGELCATEGRDGPLAPGSVNKHLAYLHSGLVLAKKEGAILEVPTVHLLRDNARERVWTEEELDYFLSRASENLKTAIAIGYWTGLRASAIGELRWTHIDLEARIARVPKSQYARAKNRPKFVPLHLRLVEFLRGREQNSGPVAGVSGRKISRQFHMLKTRLVERGEQIDADIHFHDLRHSAATNLWEAGADVPTIMAICGWRSMASLMRYITARPQKLIEAIDRVKPVGNGRAQPVGDLERASTEALIAEIQRRLKDNSQV